MSRPLIVLITLLATAALALGADVRLKSVHTAKPGLPVRLSDVAEISGTGADRIADLVVIDDPAAEQGARRWLSVTPDDIREAMRANGIATTRHTINGRRCVVRLESQARPTTPTPVVPEQAPETIDVSGTQTVRTRIAHVLAHRYGVANQDLRVLFDTGQEALLSRELGGLSCVVRPVSTHLSERIRLEVSLVRGERVVARASVTGTAQIRRPVAIVVNRLNRDDLVTRTDVKPDERWMSPGEAAESADLEAVVGRRATNRLDPGGVVRTKDVEAPVAVRRGQTVVVLTISGGVSIETTARVLRDAKVGERVPCRLHRASDPFDAVVTAPGRVLVNLDAPATGTPDAKAPSQGARP